MGGWELAVDLGTTTSAGAMRVAGRAAEVLDIGDTRTVPSVVVLQGGELVAGVHGRRLAARRPSATVHDPKRKVGGSPFVLTDESGTARSVPVAVALGALLALFVDEGTRRRNGTLPHRLLLTHPAGWNPAQCAVIRAAAEGVLPGVPVALVPEPVAAAFHHAGSGLDVIGVYDLGGGTFDTAVVRVGDGVLGRPDGDPSIGGTAFDQLVFEHFGETLAAEAPEWWERVRSGQAPRDLRDVLTAAREAKEMLSRHGEASEYIRGADLDVTIDLATFENLIATPLAETIRIMDRTIENAGVTPSAIVLTGGAARTPMVARLLRDRYGKDRIHTRDDPKLAPVLGAFTWADATEQPSPHPTAKPTRATTQSAPNANPQPTARPATAPGSQPTAQPATAPGSQPTAQPATTPGPQPTARPATAPGLQSAAQPVAAPRATPVPSRCVLVIKSEDDPARSNKTIHAFAFHPAGGLLALGGDRVVRLCDATTGQVLHRLPCAGSGHVVFSPDGELVAFGSGADSVGVWSTANGRVRHYLSGHRKYTYVVAISPNGRILATGSGDTTVRLWDTASGHQLHVLKGHKEGVRHAVFTPNGRLLATTAWDRTIRVWEVATGRPGQTFPCGSLFMTGTFNPDGTLLPAAEGRDSVALWDPVAGKRRQILRGHRDLITQTAFSPDGSVLATAGDRNVMLWNPTTGRCLHVLKGHTASVRSLAFSPDGTLLATGGDEPTVRLWDPSTGKLRGTLTGHARAAHSLTFHPTNGTLATSDADDTVRLWGQPPT